MDILCIALLLAFFYRYGIIQKDKFERGCTLDQKLVDKTIARTREIYRNNGNFHKAMKLAVNEVGLPTEQSDELLHLVATACARKSAEARARNKHLREANEALHKQRIAEEMAERAQSSNEHICPID